MDRDKLTYIVAVVVSFVWLASHVVGWINDHYTVPATVQAAMMAIVTALFSKPLLCRALKKGGRDINCDD